MIIVNPAIMMMLHGAPQLIDQAAAIDKAIHEARQRPTGAPTGHPSRSWTVMSCTCWRGPRAHPRLSGEAPATGWPGIKSGSAGHGRVLR